MRYRPLSLIAIPLMFFTVYHASAQPTISYRRVITALSAPLEITSAPDGSDRLFVVEKVGSVKVFDKNYNPLGVFVKVSGVTINGERGLLSMAFHPAYKSNGFFYVYYTTLLGDIEISRYKVSADPNVADTNSRTIIITIPHRVAANHNGGKIAFGPDGYLYFATGDGGNGGDPPNNAQNGRVLLGKMLRIDVDHTNPPLNYAIPADNPFVADTTIADEIWALGLRNPFRWSFDRQTHDMWIGDVGQGVREEINFKRAGQSKGVNFGWRCYEGKLTYNANGCKTADQYTPPLFDYPHNLATGGSSVTGGYVYRGPDFPALNGYYIFTDYISNNQWLISDSADSKSVRQQTGTFPRNIAGFGEAENGALFACSLTEGAVYKLEASTGVQVNFLALAAIDRYGFAQLTWRTTEQNIQHYEIESSDDSIQFKRIATVLAKNQSPENNYRFTENIRGVQRKFYRLRITGKDGKWDYSKTVTVGNNLSLANFIYPSVIRNRQVNFYISDSYDEIIFYGVNGALALKKSVRGFKGRMEIAIPHLNRGLYLVRIANKTRYVTQWILVE